MVAVGWLARAREFYNEEHDESGRFDFGGGGSPSTQINKALGGNPDRTVDVKAMTDTNQKVVAGQVRAFSKQFPCVAKSVGKVRTRRLANHVTALTDSADRSLTFNSGYFGPPDDQKYWSRAEAAFTTVHELGHQVGLTAAEKVPGLYNDPVWSDPVVMGQVSDYASANRDEGFAEAFAAAYGGNMKRGYVGDTLPPEVKALMDQIIGGVCA